MKSSVSFANFIIIVLYPLLCGSLSGCQNRKFGQQADSLFLIYASQDTYYDLKNPDEKYFLPYILEEISGLTYARENVLLAVDDERGKVYEYNLKKKQLTNSIKFSKPGDFEGIEMVRDTIYTLRSDGDIFEFPYTREKEAKAVKYENNLGEDNDTEGLGYDPLTNSLIISCKEKGHLDGQKKIEGRAGYGFNLTGKTLIEEPAYIIGTEELKEFWERHKAFAYEKGRIKFKPSAIAFHPIDSVFYILASIGKLIVIADRKGEILATYPVYPKLLGQPEGLCFAPNGDMYISSEGEGDKGYILKYSAKKKN